MAFKSNGNKQCERKCLDNKSEKQLHQINCKIKPSKCPANKMEREKNFQRMHINLLKITSKSPNP